MITDMHEIKHELKEMRVHIGLGTVQNANEVVKAVWRKQVEEKKKMDEVNEKRDQKKVDMKIKAAERKSEDAMRLVEEKAIEASNLTTKVADLAKRMGDAPDVPAALRLTEKTQALAQAEEARAWHPVGGVKGRNVAIVTHHEVNVPRDMDSIEVKDRVAKVNTLLASLSDGIPWVVKKVEPIPHISYRELHWTIGPVAYSVSRKKVAKVFMEKVAPSAFSENLTFVCHDLGQDAGVIVIKSVPVITLGYRNKCWNKLILANIGRLPENWGGERPPVRLGTKQNEGTGTVKLEVRSWVIAKDIIRLGVMVDGRVRKVEVYEPQRKCRARAGGPGFLAPLYYPPTATTLPQSKPPAEESSPVWVRDVRCYRCGVGGHIQPRCPLNSMATLAHTNWDTPIKGTIGLPFTRSSTSSRVLQPASGLDGNSPRWYMQLRLLIKMYARGVIMRTFSCSGAGRLKWILLLLVSHRGVGTVIYRIVLFEMGLSYIMLIS